MRADVHAPRALPIPFVLTARAENLLWGRNDVEDTVRRLQAYAEVGADVLFAPGLKTASEVDCVVRAVAPRPVNVLVGLAGEGLDQGTLQRLGVRRISVGSSLARAAYSAALDASREIRESGRFDYAGRIPALGAFNKLFSFRGAVND